jgi:putative transposase
MDETYIKVKGEWVYLYRAVDSHGDTLDFMLSERRDEEAATAFFESYALFQFLQSLLEQSGML